MTPSHHPPAELLVAYATGRDEHGVALLVASHLTLCPTCRDAVGVLERVGGRLLDEAPAADPGDGLLDGLLARLDEPAPPRPATPPPTRPDDLPAPLRVIVGPLDAVKFRFVAPGIGRADLPGSSREHALALVALRPGTRVPEHHHSGIERGMVLTGGYTTGHGHFVRGDVEIRTDEDAEPHTQLIDDGDRCVVLMVDDGVKLATTPWGKVVSWLFDR